MSSLLLGLWMAFIAADRIDLGGGHGAFMVTPFFALTPVVIVAEWTRRRLAGKPVTVGRWGVGYLTVTGAFIAISVASVVLGLDVTTGGSRVMLLAIDIVAPLMVALLVADRDDLALILARGAIVWLVVSVWFDWHEGLSWIGHASTSMRLGPVLFKFSDLQNLGFLPRLAGPVGDANHTGFMLVCDIVLIARGEPRKWLRRMAIGVAVLMLLITFSRSAFLAAAGALLVTTLGARRLSPRLALAACLAIATAVAVSLAPPRGLARAVDTVATGPISTHFSASEGSAQGHLELVRRGIDEATESIPRALIGLGYGDSYLVLQDVFPGNRYGSFHSFYVTEFAESGIFALLLLLLLVGVPLVGSPRWRAIIAASIAFNLFYQSNTDPLFWFLLAMAWLAVSWQRGRAAVPALDGFGAMAAEYAE